jgi:hypothetical protein
MTKGHTMKKLILAITSALALLTVGAASADSGASTAACGNTTYQGLRARTYCGSASAFVKVGGRTLTYRGGSCMRNRVAIELGIGTVILDAKDPKGPLPRSFGISVGRIFGLGKPAPRDGTYPSVMVAYVDKGKRYAGATGKAVLGGGRTRGTFSGRLLTGQTVSGSFRCA